MERLKRFELGAWKLRMPNCLGYLWYKSLRFRQYPKFRLHSHPFCFEEDYGRNAVIPMQVRVSTAPHFKQVSWTSGPFANEEAVMI